MKFDLLRRLTLITAAAGLAALVLSPLRATAEEPDMALELPTSTYAFNIMAENMFLRLYVNGAPIVLHGRFDQMSLSFPATEYLMPGENRIDIEYEPFDMTAQSYTPHEGVAVQVILSQKESGTTPMGDVDLFSARFDTERGTLVATEDGAIFAQPRTLSAGTISALGRYQVEPVQMLFDGAVSGDHAGRISFGFQVNDDSLHAPTYTSSPELTDGPELRRELHEAYGALHAAIAAGDEVAFLNMVKPLIERNAPAFGYETLESYAADILKASPLSGPEGSTLAPLPPLQSMSPDVPLYLGSDGRLAAAFGDPIKYVDAAGEPVGARRVFFCRVSDGTLRVCHQMDLAY